MDGDLQKEGQKGDLLRGGQRQAHDRRPTKAPDGVGIPKADTHLSFSCSNKGEQREREKHQILPLTHQQRIYLRLTKRCLALMVCRKKNSFFKKEFGVNSLVPKIVN